LEFEEKYTQVPNGWLRDKRLSRRARGLLAELLSHRPGWRVTVESLVNSGPEGRDAIRTALHELQEHGYLTVVVRQSAGGKLDGHDYVLTDPATALLETRSTGNPQHGKSAAKNTSSKEHDSEGVTNVTQATSSTLGAEHSQRLCELLAQLVRENGSKATVTKDWLDAARRTIDIDKRTPEQLERMIRWCQNDEFWRGVVLSMPKLREKYDQMRLQALREVPRSSGPIEQGRVALEELRRRAAERQKVGSA
jgi:hypothetical protein